MALHPDKLRLWRQDASYQNQWRFDAGIDEDYHDGNQYDAETARQMEERGMPLTVVNLCRDLVQTMNGMQERNQSDWVVRPEASEDYRKLSEVLSLKLKEAERMTRADRACLDGHASQHKCGIGWIEVGRNDSLLEYPYRITNPDWREMWWDPRSKSSDIITDAEYLRRVRFHDREAVRQHFQQGVSEIEKASRGSDYTVGWYEPQQYMRDHGLRDMTNASMDLWGLGRNLVAIEEIYYITWTDGYAVRTPKGRWVRFDPKNPMHMRAYESGVVQPRPTQVKQMNRAVYCGNACLSDGKSPYPHNEFPFIPIVYEREARTGSPYGLIRNIRSLQDEVNTRRARMMWGLNAKQVIYDADAVTDPDVLAEEVNRPDAMIELNPDRRPSSKLEIKTDFQLNEQQYKVYQDSLFIMPQIAGVPRSLSGQKEVGITSGVAIDRLTDQGVNSQGRPNSLYREARRRAGSLLLAMIIEDIGDQPQELTAERKDKTIVRVPVNAKQVHQDGYEYVENDVQQVQMNVVLDDVPATASFRMQQFQEIARGIASIEDSNAKAMALPFLIEASEIPNKYDIANLLRKQMGIGGEMSEQEQAAAAKDQQMQEMMKQLQVALAEANAAKTKADAELTAAKVEKTQVETAEIKQDMIGQELALQQGAPQDQRVQYRW